MRRSFKNIRKSLMGGLLPLLKLLPPNRAHRAAARIGNIEYRLLSGFRKGVEGGVEQGARYFNVRWDAPQVGKALSGNLIRWRIRDVLLEGVDDDRLGEVVSVEGRELLDRAFGQGKGVILLGSHFGAHMTPPHWLARMFYPVRLFMERPRRISAFLARQFRVEGPFGQNGLFISRSGSAADGASAVIKASRILKAGMILYIAGDVRWTGQHTVESQFLGKSYRFSTTWVLLASMTQAPVVPAFCIMNPDGSHSLQFLPSYKIPTGISQPADCKPYVQACLETIETLVQGHPCNSNDYFFWGDPAWDAGAGSLLKVKSTSDQG